MKFSSLKLRGVRGVMMEMGIIIEKKGNPSPPPLIIRGGEIGAPLNKVVVK
jgi:hypothetical protein